MAARPSLWCAALLAAGVTVTASLEACQQIVEAEPDPGGIRGALLLHGGGEVTESIRREFLQLAGGSQACIVVIPTASAEADRPDAEEHYLAPWKDLSVSKVSLLHTDSRQVADDPAFSDPLLAATGVWFSGGQQSRLGKVYVGTHVEKQLHALLACGRVIGGTSAGAAVQSRVMISSGYPTARLGTGFGLLPGTVIDQHFATRDRAKRLIGVVARHPDLIGLGIDEGAAIVVQGQSVRVIGTSTVTVCLAGQPDQQPTTIVWRAGHCGDLAALRREVANRADR